MHLISLLGLVSFVGVAIGRRGYMRHDAVHMMHGGGHRTHDGPGTSGTSGTSNTGSSKVSELMSHHKVKNLIAKTHFLNTDNFAEYLDLVKELKSLRQDQVRGQDQSKKNHTLIFPHSNVKMPMRKKTIPELADPEMADILFGDYMLSHDQIRHHISNLKNPSSRTKRQASTIYPIWTGGKIPYYFDPAAGFTDADKATIRAGFQMWQQQSCIVFNELSAADTGAVEITNTAGQGCFSNYIGMQNGGNLVNLYGGCVDNNVAAHEIGHVFGFYHHMCRYDRDTYVTVQNQNIQTDFQDQYYKETTSDTTNENTPYDYGSVMHYPPDGFAVPNAAGPTMVAANPMYQTTMGIQNSGPSFVDLLLVNNDYNCLGKCPSLACKNQGYPNPANCAVCVCPSGFAGALCDQRPQPTAANAAACAGTTLTATSSWQTATLSFNLAFTQVPVDQCTWWIQSPPNTQVQIKLVQMERYASCSLSAFELKADQPDWRVTGYKICPNTGSYGVTSLSNTPLITAVSNMAIITLENGWGTFNVQLQYQYVSSAPADPVQGDPMPGYGGYDSPDSAYAPQCVDNAGSDCAYYKNNGDCDSDAKWMWKNCAKTCGFC